MKKIVKAVSCFVKQADNKITNPYVTEAMGQRVWNDRYLTLQRSLRVWQWAFWSVLLTTTVLGCVVGYLATTSKIQPFVVETHEGMPYAIAPMRSLSTHDERLINFAINQFIINARTVVQDSEAQKALLDKVYAYAANQTLPFLHDYYQTHNPFDMANHATVTVAIISSLPMSKETWQITWDEIQRNTVDGTVMKTTRWVANVTYHQGDVNPQCMLDNPFGFYITQLHWTPTYQGVPHE